MSKAGFFCWMFALGMSLGLPARASSPSPGDGDVQTARQRIEALEARQKRLLDEIAARNFAAGQEDLAKPSAEIQQEIANQEKRPRKTFLTPSTQEVAYAMYYQKVACQIEKFGTKHFPSENGKKLHGKVVVSIPIFHDGSLFTKDGGVRIEKGSGLPALDKAAVSIVRRAAPFAPFPASVHEAKNDDVWVIVSEFNFMREEGPDAGGNCGKG